MYKTLDVSMKKTKYEQNNKLMKKVSKYRDKHGNIKIELEACIKWAKSLQNETWIFKVCYDELVEYFSKFKEKKLNALKDDKYIKNKFSWIMNKNRYPMQKLRKENGNSIYSKEDVSEFLLVLLEAVKKRKIREFLDVPDVFYIARQIKIIGVEYYLA